MARWFVETSLFVDDGRYMFIMISDHRPAECRYTVHFLMKYVLQQQFLYCFTWSSNQFLVLNSFFFLFLQTFLIINSISLCFDSWIICHLLVVWSVLTVSCAFLGAVNACLSSIMCHTHREYQLQEIYLSKYVFVRPMNESDLGHTFSW